MRIRNELCLSYLFKRSATQH